MRAQILYLIFEFVFSEDIFMKKKKWKKLLVSRFLHNSWPFCIATQLLSFARDLIENLMDSRPILTDYAEKEHFFHLNYIFKGARMQNKSVAVEIQSKKSIKMKLLCVRTTNELKWAQADVTQWLMFKQTTDAIPFLTAARFIIPKTISNGATKYNYPFSLQRLNLWKDKRVRPLK